MNSVAWSRNWARWIEPASEHALRSVRRFPPFLGQRLLDVLGVSPEDRVVEMGSGTGVLAAHLRIQRGACGGLVVLEPLPEYRRASVPSSLLPGSPPLGVRARGAAVPLVESSADVVLLHGSHHRWPEERTGPILEALTRLLAEGGRMVFLEPLGRMRWEPEWIQGEDEEERRQWARFRDLHRQLHEQLGTGLYERRRDLPQRLESWGLAVRSTRGWFQPCRLRDGDWSESQRVDLINLEHQAQRDRIEAFRELLQRADRWDPEYAQLFRGMAMRAQRKSHRQRKAFERDDEAGWTGEPLLVVEATPGRGR